MLLLLSLFGFYAKTEEKGNPCCHLWAKFRLQQERKEMLPEDVTEGEKKRQKKNGNQASNHQSRQSEDDSFRIDSLHFPLPTSSFSPVISIHARTYKDVFQLSIAEFSQTVSSVPPRGETSGQKDSFQREGLVHNGRVVCVFSVFAIAFIWDFKHERSGSIVLGPSYYGLEQRNNHGVGDIADYYLGFSHAAVDGE